ncbi:MAG: phage protein [Bradymonadaceae bacterium]
MAGLTPGYYSLDDVTCTIGPTAGAPPVNLSGYGSDGGIEYEIQEDIHSINVGADGLAVFSESNNGVVVVTITLKSQSVAAKRLATLMQAQKSFPGLPPCPYNMVDPHTGDAVSDANAVGKALPTPNKTSEASERSFEFYLPNARDDFALGPAVTPV